MKKPGLLLFSVASCFAGTMFAADADSFEEWRERMRPIVPRGYVCQKAAGPLRLDGKLDDEAWQAASWTEYFVDIEGESKPAPHFRTRARMLWDEQYLYIAAEMEEPHVWGTLTEHDSVIFHDPDFEVFIDPDGDTHEYYEFEINALNTGWDLFLPKPYKDGGKADNGWEIPGLKTAIHIEGSLNDPSDRDRGWSVEIAIPWTALAPRANRPAPPREGDQWRIGFSRVEWKVEVVDGKYRKLPNTPEANWVWSPQGVIDMHRPERWGYVQFTDRKETRFVPDPAVAARDALQEVYYAQRAFSKKNGRWGTTLLELGVKGLLQPSLQVTATGWESSLEGPVAGESWTIRDDSRIGRSR